MILNLSIFVPVAASRTRQTIGATVFFANSMEFVTAADCGKAVIALSKNKRAMQADRLTFTEWLYH